MIEKVISGGQTGADQAGLRAARTAGIPTGGFMPMGYRTLDGFKPEFESLYNMVAIDTPSYAERTRLNVMQSDCTIRIAGDFDSPGEKCTKREIRRYAKPHIDFHVSQLNTDNISYLVEWLKTNATDPYAFKIINIAGNSEKTHPGIGDAVYKFLVPVFERVQYETGTDPQGELVGVYD